jgi:hypothetical protein
MGSGGKKIEPIWEKRSDGVRVPKPNMYGAVHGTRSTYVYRGCRCDPCRAADFIYHAGHPRKPKSPEQMKRKQHGTVTGYIHWHCRCEKCTEAIRLYRKAHRERVRLEGDRT